MTNKFNYTISVIPDELVIFNKANNLRVLQINAQDTHPIRKFLDNTESPMGEHSFDMDDDDLAIHLGALHDNKLVGVASFYFEKHPFIDGENHYRLCGMATLPEFEEEEFDSALLNTAIPMIKRNFCDLIWCNVREESIDFYRGLGFQETGRPFEIPFVGMHRLMVKYLQ